MPEGPGNDAGSAARAAFSGNKNEHKGKTVKNTDQYSSAAGARLPKRGAGALAALLGMAALALPPALRAATPKTALVMAWNIDAISTFDPAQIGEVVTGELLDNLCDTLAQFDPKDESKVIPLFAESWDVSPDRMQITFHLRKGAKFPSGNIATAHDVAQGMQRV
jgi:peptide/nickel transport system substrate-binding protein